MASSRNTKSINFIHVSPLCKVIITHIVRCMGSTVEGFDHTITRFDLTRTFVFHVGILNPGYYHTAWWHIIGFKSMRQRGARMRQQIRPSLVQITACLLIGANQLSELMLVYCQMGPWEHIQVKFESKCNNFRPLKCISVVCKMSLFYHWTWFKQRWRHQWKGQICRFASIEIRFTESNDLILQYIWDFHEGLCSCVIFIFLNLRQSYQPNWTPNFNHGWFYPDEYL